MQTTKIAINGLGRIGRNALKIMLARPDIEVVAINDLGELKVLAYLFEYDSVYGNYEGDVTIDEQAKTLTINDHVIKFYSETDPAKLPW